MFKEIKQQLDQGGTVLFSGEQALDVLGLLMDNCEPDPQLGPNVRNGQYTVFHRGPEHLHVVYDFNTNSLLLTAGTAEPLDPVNLLEILSLFG